MPHDHHAHHRDADQLSDRRIIWTVVMNVGLTVAQVVGGVVSGSVALIADALHNFNDAMALVVTLVARRVARRQADERFTFGYRRAELIGATINLTALIVMGLFLIVEATKRLINPEPIDGWIVVLVAGIALLVDVGTAWLLWAMSKGSLNVRAAFIHNLSDALASVAVIVGGVCVLIWGFTLVDPLLTYLIAGYILYQGFKSIRGAVRILMQAAPPGLDLDQLVATLQAVEGVGRVYHLHAWQIDEHRSSVEAHIAVDQDDVARWPGIKQQIKALLNQRFGIDHSTLELELIGENDNGPSSDPALGHPGDLDPHTHP